MFDIKCQKNYIIPMTSGVSPIISRLNDTTSETRNQLSQNELVNTEGKLEINNFSILISGDYNAFKRININFAGIYLWSGLYKSESFPNPIYFGSAANLNKRHQDYLYGFNRNFCHNKPLLNYYNKYNKLNGLVLFLVEKCNSDECLEREQFWLDSIRPFIFENNGFNICPTAGSTLGRVWGKRTEEQCDKIGFSKRKNKNKIFFISPEGERVEVFSFKRIAEIMGCESGSAQKLAEGKIKVCKGWTSDSNKNIIPKPEIPFVFYHPIKGFYFGRNMSEFGRQNDTDSSGPSRLLKGELKQHKGWIVATEEQIQTFNSQPKIEKYPSEEELLAEYAIYD